jgi:O-Antigen ligase
MTSLAIDQRIASRSYAVPLLQVFAVTVMVFPSNAVIKAIGADGYVAALVAYCIFLTYITATLFGFHNPLDHRSPVRISVCTLWIVSLTSYVLMNRAMLNPTELASADRWLMQLAGISGVILVAAECLRSVEDIHRVLRALTWGGAFCGVVAALQFKLHLDITPYLRQLPGFSLNQTEASNVVIGSRGGLNRVPGTAIDPIELGVAAGMLLPLAVYMGIYDVERTKAQRWIPVICIAAAIPASVSRSAFLAAGIGLGVLVISLPAAERLAGLVGILLGVAAIFLTAHGLIGTLKAFFLAGTSDPSVAHRVNNYPFVEQLVRHAPWFGQGGGTYIAPDTVHILDDQYLTTAIELGLLGVAALIFFSLWPALAALTARRKTADPGLRALCAALAGAQLVAIACSATFDSLSFPMFVNVQAMSIGLIGAVWLLVSRESKAVVGNLSVRQNIVDSTRWRPRLGARATGPGGGK